MVIHCELKGPLATINLVLSLPIKEWDAGRLVLVHWRAEVRQDLGGRSQCLLGRSRPEHHTGNHMLSSGSPWQAGTILHLHVQRRKWKPKFSNLPRSHQGSSCAGFHPGGLTPGRLLLHGSLGLLPKLWQLEFPEALRSPSWAGLEKGRGRERGVGEARALWLPDPGEVALGLGPIRAVWLLFSSFSPWSPTFLQEALGFGGFSQHCFFPIIGISAFSPLVQPSLALHHCSSSVLPCVCVCVCQWVSVYMCGHACMCMHVHMCLCVYVHARVFAPVCLYMYMYMTVYVVYAHAHVCMHVHVCVFECVHIHKCCWMAGAALLSLPVQPGGYI